ncbi:acetyl-CoA C-acyltransferase [Borreliella californiensis]|uniref:Acetyl-CoA C-acetyltransferase n=1 Tax=Borreliella californiensis TaxID=373543 RepID=A0A7X0DPN7_9SPIR|nr:acetyl-CoA C-acyltransferase [Borreliella californiensis]MBB6213255.1 acetyl-CoA C-acetyltransferase [Borreliella californiensis]WKC91425.1 acetyl-CoA C-acyltransferase [Borreliella californiensis]WNY70179.1 acetyl-CoA C-acyltransferase [Borreliella californiensis]
MIKKVAIIGGLRTPNFKFGGSFRGLNIVDESSKVVKALLERNKLCEVDEVIIGNVISAGLGQNIARQIALKSGLGDTVPAFSVNKVCGSGLKALELAFNSIALGDNDIVLAGGVEDLTNSPYLLPRKIRFDGLKFGNFGLEDSIQKDALIDSLNFISMGLTAENLSEKYKITREMQDEFAYNSHKKALKARELGYFEDEIYPLAVFDKKTNSSRIVSSDEEIRDNLTLNKLASLNSVFKESGTITAGNSSSLNDGACFLILASEERTKSLGISPLAYIGGFKSVGLDPLYMGFGAYMAIEGIISKLSLNPSEIDLIEVNEAFAAQALSIEKALFKKYNITSDIINVNGGAIALGHPFAVSGSRILLTLSRSMKMKNKTKGIVSICIGGGQGISSFLYR